MRVSSWAKAFISSRRVSMLGWEAWVREVDGKGRDWDCGGKG
jgi:hypothetical protein